MYFNHFPGCVCVLHISIHFHFQIARGKTTDICSCRFNSLDKHVMSRLLDQANAWPSNSRLQSHTLQFIGSISHYVHNNGHNQQSPYNNTAEPQTGYHKHLLQKETTFANGTFLNNNGDSKSPIPLPDWSVALTTWGISWNFHVYGFSALFVMLTVVSVAIFLRFRPRVQRFKIVYNTLILLAASGMFRAVFLLVDPYGYKGRMARLMVGVMMQAVYPLLCACYGLTQVIPNAEYVCVVRNISRIIKVP